MSLKCWIEDNKRRRAVYTKRSEAIKDANDFNSICKKRGCNYKVRKLF